MINSTGQSISMHGSYRKVLFPMEISFKARGRAKLQVLNPDRSVAREMTANNLILNQGIDSVATTKWCDTFLYCCAGSGSTPTSDSGGATTAAQSGTALTLTGGSFTFTNTFTDGGKIIRWVGAQQARIVTVTDGTHAVVDVSQTVSGAAFTMYRTNQTGLVAEIVRTNNYVTGAGNCGTTLTGGNVFAHVRTWDFPTEVGNVTYNEVGFSNASGAGANLFSRIILGAPLPLVAGQTLRVIYTLQITVSPTTPNAKAAAVLGWPVAPSVNTNGNEQIQYYGLSSVNTSGATVAYDAGNFVNEPSASSNVQIFLSTVTTSLASVGTATDRTGSSPAVKAVTLSSYTANTGTLDKFGIYGTSEGNSASLFSIGIGRSDGGFFPYVNNTFVFVFTQSQTKDSLHTLELHFTFNWAIDLS